MINILLVSLAAIVQTPGHDILENEDFPVETVHVIDTTEKRDPLIEKINELLEGIKEIKYLLAPQSYTPEEWAERNFAMLMQEYGYPDTPLPNHTTSDHKDRDEE